MELRHLRYFVGVAEELNVRRAAQRLHISQPPLSRQIHDLENELDVKLFERGAHGLALTSAGECFLNEARQILARVRQAADLARAAGRGEAGQLNIAILPPLGGLFLPAAIRAFRKRLPMVELTISELLPQDQIAALIDQRIDLGFLPSPTVDPRTELIFEPVREVELIVALPPDHPLTRLRRLTLRKLVAEPFVIVDRSVAALLHDRVLQLCRQAGFEPHVAKMANGVSSLLDLVSAGFGVSILPALFQRFPSDAVFRSLPPSTPRLALALAWRRDNRSPLLNSFLEILRPLLKKKSMGRNRSRKARD